MNRKVTIIVSEDVCEGLHCKIGRRRISQFLEKLARPHVLSPELDVAYREMALGQTREREALAWSEGVIGDLSGNEPDAPH